MRTFEFDYAVAVAESVAPGRWFVALRDKDERSPEVREEIDCNRFELEDKIRRIYNSWMMEQ